jgi:hypothetical protein
MPLRTLKRLISLAPAGIKSYIPSLFQKCNIVISKLNGVLLLTVFANPPYVTTVSLD